MEDFYKHEMQKLVDGVELDETAEVINQQVELEAEGIDLDQSQGEEQKEEAQVNFAMQHR